MNLSLTSVPYVVQDSDVLLCWNLMLTLMHVSGTVQRGAPPGSHQVLLQGEGNLAAHHKLISAEDLPLKQNLVLNLQNNLHNIQQLPQKMSHPKNPSPLL